MNRSDSFIYRLFLQNTDVGTVEHHKKVIIYSPSHPYSFSGTDL